MSSPSLILVLLLLTIILEPFLQISTQPSLRINLNPPTPLIPPSRQTIDIKPNHALSFLLAECYRIATPAAPPRIHYRLSSPPHAGGQDEGGERIAYA